MPRSCALGNHQNIPQTLGGEKRSVCVLHCLVALDRKPSEWCASNLRAYTIGHSVLQSDSMLAQQLLPSQQSSCFLDRSRLCSIDGHLPCSCLCRLHPGCIQAGCIQAASILFKHVGLVCTLMCNQPVTAQEVSEETKDNSPIAAPAMIGC